MRAPKNAQKIALHWKAKIVYELCLMGGQGKDPYVKQLEDVISKRHETLDIVSVKNTIQHCELLMTSGVKSVQKIYFMVEELLGIMGNNASQEIPLTLSASICQILKNPPVITSDRILVDGKLRCIINKLVPNQYDHLKRMVYHSSYHVPNWEVSFSGFTAVCKCKRYSKEDKENILLLVNNQILIFNNLYNILIERNEHFPFSLDDTIDVLRYASWVPADSKDTVRILNEGEVLHKNISERYGISLW